MREKPGVEGLAGTFRVVGVFAQEPPHGGAELGFVGCWIGNCHLPRIGLLPSLGQMRRNWQAVVIFCMAAPLLGAAEGGKGFAWSPPKVDRSIFNRDLGMLDAERDEYATNLATVAANAIAAAKASPASLADARRMLALALQLSPRNKKAVVLNFQLSKGVLPEKTEGNYSPQVFARLILSRGQLLEKQGGAENETLARYFIQLAAEMDPKNEDAVYASEVQRLDLGSVDWSAITDVVEEKP